MEATSFTRGENIGARRVGDEIFILAPAGDLIVLENETAVFLWEAVEGGAGSTGDLRLRLLESYNVSEEQAALDVENFVRLLIERDVLLAKAS